MLLDAVGGLTRSPRGWALALALGVACSSNDDTTEPSPSSATGGAAPTGGKAAAGGGLSETGGGSGASGGVTPASGGAAAGGRPGNAGSAATPTGGAPPVSTGGAPPASTGGSSTSDGGAGGEPSPPTTCEPEVAPTATGKTIPLTPADSLAEALGDAAPGDRLLLSGGDYDAEDIQNRSFDDFVFIEAAPDEKPIFSGLRFQKSDHLVLDGVRVEGTLELAGSSDFILRNVELDAGDSEEAALHFQGQGGSGATHDVLVRDSKIQGGGRTVFVLGSFAPSEAWNHHLTFTDNEFTCGSRVCFQISGGRDLVIRRNRIDGVGSNGILTAGATRVTVAQNRFHGDGASALQLATPGAEWDNYAGVENMISSEIVVANNLIDGFANGIQFDAAEKVSVVYNTVAEGSGIRFNHRVPKDQDGNVILDGNREVRVWNNILPSLSTNAEDGRPSFESNNLVWKSGGGGENLLSDDPELDPAADFSLKSGSSAVDQALITSDTPAVDLENRFRGDAPDLGARELGATENACP